MKFIPEQGEVQYWIGKSSVSNREKFSTGMGYSGAFLVVKVRPQTGKSSVSEREKFNTGIGWKNKVHYWIGMKNEVPNNKSQNGNGLLNKNP